MKRILFYLIVLFNISANGQNFYEKIFYNQQGTACAREDSAGNIIVAFAHDSKIVKFDSLLNPIWTKTYNFSTNILEILDNGNLISGGDILIGNLLYAHIALLDPNGDTLWTRTPVVASQKGVYQLKVDYTGNFYFMVFQIPGITPVQLFKMDLNGNVLASTNTGNGNDFHFNIIRPNLIVTAYTSQVNCEVDGYDSTLTQLWNNTLLDTISNPHTFRAGVVFPNTNNHVIVGGWWDWYTSLFDLTSSTLNNITTLGNYGSFSEVIQTSLGGYLCIGNTNGTNKGFAYRFDLVWYVEFNGINGVTAKFVQQTNDGGFLISGSTTDLNSSKIPWMTKLDHLGSITTGLANIQGNSTFQINTLNHSFEITQTKGNKLIIYDIHGRVVKSIENIQTKFSFDFFEKQGIYLFSLYKNNEFIESKKVCIF